MSSPVFAAASAVGYQSVGINPDGERASVSGFLSVAFKSKTATAFTDASATNNLAPSGESVSALGVLPGYFCPGTVVSSKRTAPDFWVEITATRSALDNAT